MESFTNRDTVKISFILLLLNISVFLVEGAAHNRMYRMLKTVNQPRVPRKIPLSSDYGRFPCTFSDGPDNVLLDCTAGLQDNECNKTCRCPWYKFCNHVHGSCYCRRGFTGDFCDRECTPGTFGDGCLSNCTCPITAVCHHITGKCTCLPGWHGEDCNLKCTPGTYGYNCSSRCECPITAYSTCHHITGNCNCQPGWRGEHCNHKCTLGLYGEGCQETCLCTNNATCDHVSGNCTCTGPYCDEDPQHEANEKTKENIGGGKIAEIVVGTFLVLVVVGVIVFLFVRQTRINLPWCRKSKKNAASDNSRGACAENNNESTQDSSEGVSIYCLTTDVNHSYVSNTSDTWYENINQNRISNGSVNTETCYENLESAYNIPSTEDHAYDNLERDGEKLKHTANTSPSNETYDHLVLSQESAYVNTIEDDLYDITNEIKSTTTRHNDMYNTLSSV